MDSEVKTRGLLTEKQGKLLFIVWLMLLLPWLIIAPLIAMGFDSPPTLSVYIGVGAIWSYPISVCVAGIFRKNNPVATLFPLMNFVILGAAFFIRP